MYRRNPVVPPQCHLPRQASKADSVFPKVKFDKHSRPALKSKQGKKGNVCGTSFSWRARRQCVYRSQVLGGVARVPPIHAFLALQYLL